MALTREQQKAMFAKAKSSKQHGSFGVKVDSGFFRTETEGEAIARAERVNDFLQDKKNATIGDIKKVITESTPLEEPLLQTELTDILTEVGDADTGEIDNNKLDKVAKKSIESILKREKFLPKGYTVDDLTQVSVREETGEIEFKKTGEGESGFYQYDFSIRKDGKPTDLGGTAFGTISAGDVIDMELELFKQ